MVCTLPICIIIQLGYPIHMKWFTLYSRCVPEKETCHVWLVWPVRHVLTIEFHAMWKGLFCLIGAYITYCIFAALILILYIFFGCYLKVKKPSFFVSQCEQNALKVSFHSTTNRIISLQYVIHESICMWLFCSDINPQQLVLNTELSEAASN